MSVNDFAVYMLLDPQTSEVRYIGISCNVQRRYRQHISAQETGNPMKQAWIDGLKAQGLRPTLVTIEQDLKKAQALIRERHFIQMHLEHGAHLTNRREAELLPEECREVQG